MVVANKSRTAELKNHEANTFINHLEDNFSDDKSLNVPIDEHDEGWWESVLSDEERVLPGTRNRATNDISSISTKAITSYEEEASIRPVDWEYVQSIYHSDQIIQVSVSGYNRGGLLVESKNMYGFVPYSHLVEMTCQVDSERELFLAEYQGKELRLKVIECVPEENRIIFSERAALADAGKRTELFSSLQQGQITSGEVTNITEFGAFIDLGGVEGLIHISELSWGRVAHPGHILKLGQKVTVQIIEILPERCRIALSLKRLQENPWEHASSTHQAEDIVPVTITRVVSFGIFARMQTGLEGLIHISEIEMNGKSLRELYIVGQQIYARILHLDPKHQRLGLSLKSIGNTNND